LTCVASLFTAVLNWTSSGAVRTRESQSSPPVSEARVRGLDWHRIRVITMALQMLAAFLAVLLSIVAGQPTPQTLCPNDAPGSLCTVFNQSITFQAGLSLSFQGSVIFSNSSISSGPCDSVACPAHSLWLTVGGNLSLVATTFTVPSAQILANGAILIDSLSIINSTGAGPLSLFSEGSQGAGGGHGGSGAESPYNGGGVPGQANGLANLTSPFDFGGAASFLSFSGLSFSRGGGRIWVGPRRLRHRPLTKEVV
jgi:hypothetical protein